MDAAQAEPPAGPKPPEAEPAKAKKGSSSKDAKPKKEKSKDKDKAESKSKSKSKDKASSSSSSQSRRSGSMADEAAATTATGGEKPPAEAAAAAPVPALGPPPTPTEARGMARTLSFHGGLAVTEALHAELAMGVLHLVENEEDASGGLTLQAPGVIAREERGNPRSPLGGGSGKLPRPTVMGDTCHATLSLYPVLTGAGSNQQRCGFLEAVVDAGPTRRLEKAGALNWHAECPYLVALKTESDGNCLCHAAALGTWGVHDRKLLLRHAVRSLLVDGRHRAVRLMRRAWERELGRHGVTLAPEDLDLEWATLARQAEETSPAGAGAMDGGNGGYAYLEAAHVYALAHVLRRPIVVLATDWVNAQGKTLARAEEIAGIYLPYALPRRFVARTPLLLAFDSFHFSPLVPMDPSKPARVPLVQGPASAAATAKSGSSTSSGGSSLLPLPFFFPTDSKSPPTREEALAVLQSYLDCETLPDGTLVARVDPDRTAPEGMAAVLLQNAMAAVTGGSPASSINGGTPPRRHSGASPGFPSRSSSSSSLASWLTPIGPARHPPAPRDPMAGAAAGSSASSVGSASTVGSGGSVSSSKGGSGSLYKTSGNASASSYTPPRNLHSLGQLRRQQTPAEAAASAAAIAAWSSGIRRRDSGSESGGAGAGAGRRRSRPDGVAASWEEEDERARAAAQRVNSMAKSASWCCPPGMAPLPRARKITVERTSSVGDLSGSAAAADAPMATATVPPADGGPEFTRVLAQVYEDDACTGAGREREDVFTALARAVKEAAAQSKQAALETSTSLTKRATEAGTVLKNPRALLQQLPVTGGGAVAGITAGVKGLWVGVGGKEGKGSASANPSPGAAAGVEETKAGEPMTGSSSVAAPAPAQEGAEPPQPGMEAAEGAKKKKERKEKDKEKRSKDKGKAGKEGKEGGKKEKKEKKSKREKPPQQEGAGEAAVEAEQQLAPVEPAAAIEA